MKMLFLIRHAKSSWDDAGVADFDRPLNARGTKDADEMAKRLAAKIATIDAFVSSPALRAKTTAEKFIVKFGKDKSQVVLDHSLYLAPASLFSQLINQADNKHNSLAIFSHNPGITDFANTLAPAVMRTDNIPTCGIFAVRAAIDNWTNFSTANKAFLFFDYPKLFQ